MEERKSINEELRSVNVEQQSSNQELKPSQEKIQSMDEELRTVTGSSNVDELDHDDSDWRNCSSVCRRNYFSRSVLVVRSFTSAVAEIYHLIAADQGRPLSDIVSQIDNADLGLESATCSTRRGRSSEVTRKDGNSHDLMRILPYRAADNRVDGVLIAYVDVASVVPAGNITG